MRNPNIWHFLGVQVAKTDSKTSKWKENPVMCSAMELVQEISGSLSYQMKYILLENSDSPISSSL